MSAHTPSQVYRLESVDQVLIDIRIYTLYIDGLGYSQRFLMDCAIADIPMVHEYDSRLQVYGWGSARLLTARAHPCTCTPGARAGTRYVFN